MHKNTIFTTIALCAATVLADSPTTQIFLAGFDQQSIVGSVIASDSTATTFSIACANTAKCELPDDFTFTQGPSTVHYAYTHQALSSDDVSGTIDVACAITTDHGSCTKSVNAFLGTITSTATSSITTFSGASALGAQILTVTAGQLVLPTTASSTTSSASSHSSSSSKSVSSSSHSSSSSSFSAASSTITAAPSTTPDATSAPSDTPSSSAASVQASSSSTGGMPRITGMPQWIIGGAAAAVALAAL